MEFRRTHFLKTHPASFVPVALGVKTAEFRKNDRNFAVLDKLILAEWIAVDGGFTGRQVHALVTHVLEGGQFGVPEGYCMLSIVKEFTVFYPGE